MANHIKGKEKKKIAINTCFGGFSLSRKAMERLIQLGYTERHWNEKGFGGYNSREEAIEATKNYGFVECERDDKRLIKVIEEMGSKKASGSCAKIKIVKIPAEIDWEIDEYDGLESVEEKHESWS